MKKFILILSLVLSGCGGGGGGGSSPAPTPTPQSVEVPLFKAPVELPDLKNVYSRLCDYNTNLQNIYVADLNKDGKKDLVLTLWCNQIAGTIYNGPVINGIIVLIQQSDGTFVDDTKKMFGVDFINLSGVVINGVVHDFNKDGYDDIVFAVNREDGRLPSEYPALNQNEYNAFITSNGKGGYDIIRQGQFAWNYGVSLIDNATGGKDVMSIPIGYNGIVETWNYNTGWNLNTEYQWVRGNGPVFMKDQAVVDKSWPDLGIRLFSKTNNTWSQVDSYSFGDYTQVPWLAWSKSLGLVSLMTINNKDYVSISMEHKCKLKFNPTDTDYKTIVALFGKEIIGGYKGGVVDESSGLLTPKTTLMAFDTKSNKINKISTFKIDNFVDSTDVYHMVCGDLNNDGYDDIMIQDWRKGTSPMIYLNDKANGFNRVNTSNIPGLYQYNRGQSYIYEDLDGDGIRDLLHFPIVGLNNPIFNSVKLLLHKGNRHLEAKDMLPKN
jgi:hypothetical protein